MIQRIAPTHKAATIKADRIKQARRDLKAAELHTLKENLAFGAVMLAAMFGAFLISRVIVFFVRLI